MIDGNVELNTPDGKWAAGGPGLLAIFDPPSATRCLAVEDSRILLVLSPWPGDGHPSQPEEVARPSRPSDSVR